MAVKKKKTSTPKSAPTTAAQGDYVDAFQRAPMVPADTVSETPPSSVQRKEYVPGILESYANLPPAWIPVRTVVDKNGFAVAVDINDYDINGNFVAQATKEDLAALQSSPENIKIFDEAAANAVKAADTAVQANIDLKNITVASTSGAPTTQTDVIKAGLKAMRFKSNIIDTSTTFIETLMGEGLDFDKATDILLNNKNYTLKSGVILESPFFREYTSLAELSPASEAKTPAEIFNMVLGMEDLVKKYSISPKWAERSSLEKYVKNNISVSDLDKRANLARLKGITADPVYTTALQDLGFIKTGQDLTDFFMDPDIGSMVFEERRGQAAIASEALRRASAGISVDTARIKQLSAALTEQGYSPDQIQQEAARSYETIAQQLPGLTKLSGMYDKTAKPVPVTQLQQELEAEQMLGMPSQRRKRLEEREQVEFEGRSGRARTKINIAGLV